MPVFAPAVGCRVVAIDGSDVKAWSTHAIVEALQSAAPASPLVDVVLDPKGPAAEGAGVEEHGDAACPAVSPLYCTPGQLVVVLHGVGR